MEIYFSTSGDWKIKDQVTDVDPLVKAIHQDVSSCRRQKGLNSVNLHFSLQFLFCSVLFYSVFHACLELNLEITDIPLSLPPEHQCYHCTRLYR